LLELVELQDRADAVGGAGAELPLVVHGRHLLAQAHGSRQALRRLDRQEIVTHVGAVGPPAVPLLRPYSETVWCPAHDPTPCCEGGAPAGGSAAPVCGCVPAGGPRPAAVSLLATGTMEVSVSCAQRSLKPARKASTRSARCRWSVVSWEA